MVRHNKLTNLLARPLYSAPISINTTYPMHRFRTVLSKFIRENNWTQQQLASRLDADQATVSRWLSGRVEMGASSLQRLLAEIPLEHRSLMLEAYLRDCVPEGFEELVQITPANPSTLAEYSDSHKADEPKFPEPLEPELRKRLVYFAHMVTRSPDVRKLLDVVYRLASKKKA